MGFSTVDASGKAFNFGIRHQSTDQIEIGFRTRLMEAEDDGVTYLLHSTEVKMLYNINDKLGVGLTYADYDGNALPFGFQTLLVGLRVHL
jgi:hypothetical protein